MKKSSSPPSNITDSVNASNIKENHMHSTVELDNQKLRNHRLSILYWRGL